MYYTQIHMHLSRAFDAWEALVEGPPRLPPDALAQGAPGSVELFERTGRIKARLGLKY